MTLGLLALLAAVFGAAFASFLEVLADRLPKGEWPSGRSHCPQCGRLLSFLDLLPVLGWVLRRGRCASCSARIPVRHVIGELSLALSFFVAVITIPVADGIFLGASEGWEIAFRLLMLSALFVVIVADLRFYIIPDLISLGLVGLLGLAHILGAFFEMPYEHVLPVAGNALWGMLFGIGFLGTFSVISRGTWMGWGDVKLAAGLGLAFGFPAIVITLGLSFMLGAVIALLMVGLKLRTMKDMLPFGPFIALAAIPFLFGLDLMLYKALGIADFIKLGM